MKKVTNLLAALVLSAVAVGLGAQTLKTADNFPDRTSGSGAIVEQINKEFKAANPGVDITVESYPDQPYQQKIKIYATAGQLPDVFKYWSFSSLLKPLVDNKFVLPLNKADFDKLGYLPGALEGNMYGGKLYGIPVSADFWVIFYNKKLFKDIGVTTPPTTLEDLIALVPKFQAKNIIPMTTDGKDAWPLSITFDQLAVRISGDPTLPQKALDRTIKFTDPVFVQAATQLQNLAKSGLLAKDLLTSDYGASRNLFGQGRAAMYLMGAWEVGLATDSSFSDEFKANVDAFKFPTLKGGKGKLDDLQAWYGGNYVISSATKNPDLAVKYLKFYAQRYPVLAWQQGGSFPAQKVTPLATDTTLAKTLLKIAADAKLTTGTASLDLSTPQFKEDNQNAMRELVAGLITPQQFVQKLDAAAEKASKASN